jgi:hypothetical protein
MGKTKEIVVRLEPALHAELVARAEADDRSMAATVRYALRLYLSMARPAPGRAVFADERRPAAVPIDPETVAPPASPLPVRRWPDPDDPATTLRYPDVEVSSDGGKTWAPFDLAVRASLRTTCADNRCHDDSHGNLYRAVGSNADPSTPVFHRPATKEQLAQYRRDLSGQ